MSKRPGLKEVAQLAGVSATTVSHVINHTRYVEPETEQRVRNAIKELNYVNNSWARMLRSERSEIIGILITDLTNPFTITITNCAMERVREKGYQLYIVPISNTDYEANDRAIQTLISYRAEGVLSVPIDNEVLHRIMKQLSDIPVCCIEGDPEMTDTVDTDHEEAAYKTTRILAEAHSRIGFIKGAPQFITSEARYKGYLKALQDSGIPFREEYVAEGDSSVPGGYQAMRRLLGTEITAVFVGNNMMLQGAVKAINDVNSDLFSKLAIVGFDDQDWYALYRPTITAIRQPLPEIVDKAVDLLFARIQEPDRPLQKEIIPAELIRRESF